MGMPRTKIAFSPAATLDERIRALFPPGAIYNCHTESIGTVAERRMRQLSLEIRSQPDWAETINDADTRAVWTAEAKAKWMTDVELAYVLDELAHYASLHPLEGNVRFSAADGVWFSDTLLDAKTTDKLRDYAAILENVPDRQKDWYPNDRSRILNLIDPSLYPLDYTRSKLCLQTSSSPQAALSLENAGEFPGSLSGWHTALDNAGEGKSDYYLSPVVKRFGGTYYSKRFSWLPSEFRVDDNGAVTIESYINNLHPVKHAALYAILADVFSNFLPLLEQVVTDLAHPREPRVQPKSRNYYKSDEPMPDEESDDYREELRLWRLGAEFLLPQPEQFAPPRPIDPYKLCGRRLQAMVKMTNVELTSKRPIYGGEDWTVAGLENERIIATGMCFYDVANIASCSLKFRETLCPWDFMVDQFDIGSVIEVYGLTYDQLVDGEVMSQELGTISIKDGLSLVFPNTLQYKMPELKLVDKKQPGHCKMLTFYFVDPSTRIPSTEIVPPQQQDWCFEDVLTSEPFCSLPQLVVDGIMRMVDFPISLKEAKKLRPQVHQDETSKYITHALFEPMVYFSA
ncbi:hypothetical protein GGI06_000660 [Coemansia sp. S85]|nr:hypothetical protein GGI06_000660 [Coemansia sp. S85]